ncbi:pentatricopeptide repeat-containing protein At2g36730-like [Cornus florida]|uniref:pentatricopeptide repeat-containing protein At2g36730-like n=1 Tax=Cornus florida TaxID=4283 RepID=UPI00289BAEE8|nr:pentatricopeptide repeat-containing protein At2g36730-like [Cornus florida]
MYLLPISVKTIPEADILNVMIPRQFQILCQRSKTTNHLLQLHSLILKTALNYDHYFISQFMLSACSVSIEFARSIFDSSPVTPPLFVWSTIIREYSKSSMPIESVKLFSKLQRIGHKPDKYTYPFVIKACGRCSLVQVGGAVHSLILKTGFDWDRYVDNTLLRMYGAFHAIDSARQVFDEMTDRDVVSWSSMIAGYVACNCPLDALMAFQEMKLENEKPNSVTLVSLLSACTHLLNIRIGKSIHSYVLVNNIGLDVVLGTALLEIYAKCGHIAEAFYIFNSMREKNLQSWTVMISGLADHGHVGEAISLFTKMEQTGLKPDSVSFSAILSACSHLGLVDEGQKYFEKMFRIYNIMPTMEHYGCMVDMFGRSGMIEEAYQIIRNMPMKPNPVILRSFMSACNNHGVVHDLDENMRKLLLEIEPDLGANYVLVANVSSLSGYWNDADELRVAMKDKGLKKVPGCSWVGGSKKDMIKEAVR